MDDHHTHTHSHDDGSEHASLTSVYLTVGLLIIIFLIRYFFDWWDMDWVEAVAYGVAFTPVALPVMAGAWELLRKEHSFFNEYALMSIAAVGAFALGQYTEAVMLMLLYQIGEYLQGRAVVKARKDISRLADVRSATVLRVEDGDTVEIPAESAQVGYRIRVLAGMRVSLDGTLLSDNALLDQSALTGESRLVEREKGETVLAGSVVSGKPIEITVTKPYEDSTLARILQMTEEANERKPRAEHTIRRFSRIYTPIVFALAVLVVLLPWIVSLIYPNYVYYFDEWFYKSLVFLVVSCPCALVISVPLTYFSGMGAVSRHGILLKGALFLEQLRNVTAVAFDKTGTITEGVFEVTEVKTLGIDQDMALSYISGLELQSRHPMAVAIQEHTKGKAVAAIIEMVEVTGMGLTGQTDDGTSLLAGSEKMMLKNGLEIPDRLLPQGQSAILLAVDGKVVATVLLSDKIKQSSAATVKALHRMGISKIVMLSGDKPEVTADVARTVGIDEARGGLLPDGKMRAVEQLIQRERVAFVGDGLNDAPVMSMSHIGVAMGGIGSDATIEAADVVIQGDDPYKVVQAIEIARFTHKIVLQNVIFALGFKMVVMLLAVVGFASLSLAVVADVGVTLLAVVNALRALYFKARNN